MPSTTSSPPTASLSTTVHARAKRSVARFEIILKWTLPSVTLSTNGATASAIVFTAFAPIASLQSTSSSTTSISPRVVWITLARKSFAPPPAATSIGSCSSAFLRISSFACMSAIIALQGSFTFTVCICPIIIGSVLLVKNPPLLLAIFAA